MSDSLRRQFHHELQLDCETGVGTDDVADPQIMLRWSDDGGHTWGNEHWASMGAQGAYGTRVRWMRLGPPRNRVYEISGTDAVPIAILAADLNISDGRH